SLRSLAGVVGKVVLGSLADRVGARKVVVTASGLQLVIWIVLLQWPSVPMLIGAGLGLGFAGGALYPLRGALVGQLFGRAGFSSVTGILATMQLLPSLLAPPMAGTLYDQTGDYAAAFQAFLVVYLVAPILLALIRMPARPH
ncbi:MFS transporter, partial [Myxococcota bacterium]|nr:MFS transporter [Myxococcota bacterium]